MSSTWPVRESRYWCTRSSTSPQIISGEAYCSGARNRSSVDWIVPCPEFSTGTTPKSAAPEATSSNTSSTLASGSALAECPKCLCTACCENVPSGRSEEHTSELQSLMRISYAVFCLKQKILIHLYISTTRTTSTNKTTLTSNNLT